MKVAKKQNQNLMKEYIKQINFLKYKKILKNKKYKKNKNTKHKIN